MPFQPGNQISKGVIEGKTGRKGYEYEKKQMDEMKKILNEALSLLKEIQKGRASRKDVEKFRIMEKSILKIMDKIHANKQETKLNVESPILIKRIKDNETGNGLRQFMAPDQQTGTGAVGG